jgi:hypothetical protein
MRVRSFFFALVNLFAVCTTAHARRDAGTVECHSSDYKYLECPTSFRGAELVRQTSDTACVRNKTWGFNDQTGSVWVSGGCAGEFGEAAYVDQGAYDDGGRDRGRRDRDRDDAGDSDDSIGCASSGHRFQRCDAPWRAARLVRQLSDSDCVENLSWGVDGEGLWVDQGCAGRFAEVRGGGHHQRRDDRDDGGRSDSASFTCESHGGDRERCALPRGVREGDINVDEQLSQTPCRRGEIWDYDGRELWISGGCRARFSVR